jgi:ABC-2 type transport system ATP-binding protein
MIIEANDLWKEFGRTEALRGASFAVPDGAAFALIGANGAGKTTTIKTLLNILHPSKGTARVLGVPTTALGPREFAQIGHVSENIDLPAGMTVGRYLNYLRPFYPAWDAAIETRLQDRFRLPPDRAIRSLSHGMRMKLAFLAALPYRPRLLVLDEPFGGIDPLVRDELMEGLLDQAGETTIFISSHDLNEIEGMVTHVGYLEHGKLLFQDSMDDLRARVRAVSVVTDGEEAPRAAPFPTTWLNLRREGRLVTFVDTQFRESGFAGAIAAHLGKTQRIDAQPLSLRETFIALAKHAEETAA